MQKKLLTVAVAGALAAPVAALAQVTVYGSIDTGIKQQSKIVTGAGTDDSKLSIDGQIKKSNRWGLKGSEDLGGGLMANFTLEGAYASDTGADGTATTLNDTNAGLFNRVALVGLSGKGWNVDLGKNYTLNFRTHGIYDPLSHDYGGAAGFQSTATASVRAANSITAGFRFGAGGVGLQYAPGEQTGTAAANNFTAFNGDMAFGPVTVGVAFGTHETSSTVDTTTTNIGAAYKMGAFTFRLGMSTEDIDQSNETQKISGGVEYQFSPTLVGRVSFYDVGIDDAAGNEVGTGESFILNVEYSLSKRTLVYAVFDRKGFSGNQLGTTVGSSLRDGATGIGAGIVHNF